MKQTIKAFKTLSPFIKPFAFPYIIGIILYSSQSFIFALLHSLYLNQLTSAILSSSSTNVKNTTILFIISYLLYLIFLTLGTYVSNIAVAKMVKSVKKKIFQHYLYLNIESPDLINKNPISSINSDADLAIQLVFGPVSRVLSCSISIIFSSLTLFLIDTNIGIFSILVGISGLCIQLLFTKPLAINEQKKLEKNASINQSVINAIKHIITIKSFNLQEKTNKDTMNENNEYLSLSYKEAFISTWQNLFMTFQGWLSLVGAFIFGSYLISKNLLTLPALIMVPTLSSDLARGMGSLGASFALMQGPAQAVKRLDDILNSKPILSKKKEIIDEPWDGSYQLETNSLNFSYLTTPNPILKNIKLTIKENTINIFIGPSGSGKTSLLKVIMGLYDRDDLSMTCGNLKYQTSSKSTWNKLFAYIDQSYQLFDMSIEQNIKLSNLNSTKEEIVDASKKAYAYDFIMQLEQQFNTRITENGGNLSGGQLQRIAIARAINKAAPILIFDEPTSALDETSSKEIIETIEHLSQTHTILLVTHQLETLPKNAIIHFLDQGYIKESGTHEELIKKKGYYHQYLKTFKDTIQQ